MPEAPGVSKNLRGKRMELKISDKLYGFTVTNIRDIEEIEGQLVEMVHDKTGAGLVWASSKEENKLFSVGFRTLPEDNTGVFHILEHSVLCGSERFPVKEPFVELLKTSMNTFLNAMTYPDKTLYPVSSRMEQDYLNLMDVYLDAVFCPRILTCPDIFYQEGWHIDTCGDKPVFKGVVLNEMKGAMSEVDQIAERTLLKAMYPDSCYGFNSGGDPDAIPDLTYESFLERYRKFYHPSNSYFYLDGDIPIEKTLSKIDSYLDRFDRLGEVPELTMQEPVRADIECHYEVSSENSKAVVAAGRITGTWEDRDKLLVLNVLAEQLADSNESPLKRAVLSSGLAEDMELFIADGIAQPYITFVFRGVDPDSASEAASKLLEIVRETTEKVLQDGIPERDLEASINQMDFRFRQYPEPQGLARANVVFYSWLYGGDPALYLRTGEAVSSVRRLIREGEAEKLAREFFTDTDGYSIVTVLPSATLGEEAARIEAERVDAAIKAMDEEEYAALIKMNEELLKWQETPDNEEALATIPQLDIADISRVPELISTEAAEKDGVTLLYHKLPTNGIVYINAYFPITDLSFEELPAAALVTEFYKDLPTENYSVTELQNEIRMYIGSISFGIDIIAKDKEHEVCTPVLRGRAAVLRENLSHAEDILVEIMTRTRFEDKEKMRELVTQIDEDGRRSAVSSGHRLAIYAARSRYSARDAATEAVNGYTFTQYMHRMNEGFDDEIDGFVSFAKALTERSVVRSGAIVSITASEETDVTRFIASLEEGSARPAAAAYESPLPAKLGIIVPASVSHSVEAYDLTRMGARSHGSLAVAANILSLSHLWNEIRVKGGSYGASVVATRTGSILCYSYRDPSPARSLGIYKTTPDFLDAFASGGAPLDGFIISTVASTEPLVSPGSKGRSGDDFWLSGFTDEDRIRVRGEILDTTAEDLRSWREAFEKFASEGRICVIGPKSALETCDGLEMVNI